MWAFIWNMAAFSVGCGLLFSIVVIVPAFVYIVPYGVWLGWNAGTKGIPRKRPSSGMPAARQLRHNIGNATKLYRSWLAHAPHNITDW